MPGTTRAEGLFLLPLQEILALLRTNNRLEKPVDVINGYDNGKREAEKSEDGITARKTPIEIYPRKDETGGDEGDSDTEFRHQFQRERHLAISPPILLFLGLFGFLRIVSGHMIDNLKMG
jgi:hypothetical protein